jgi:hypothetical protein
MFIIPSEEAATIVPILEIIRTYRRFD